MENTLDRRVPVVYFGGAQMPLGDKRRQSWAMPRHTYEFQEIPERKVIRGWTGVVGSSRDLAHQLWLADRTNFAGLLFSESVDVHRDIRGGIPVLRGTRIPLSHILAELADGYSIKEIAEDMEVDENVIRNFMESMSVILDRPFA